MATLTNADTRVQQLTSSSVRQADQLLNTLKSIHNAMAQSQVFGAKRQNLQDIYENIARQVNKLETLDLIFKQQR